MLRPCRPQTHARARGTFAPDAGECVDGLVVEHVVSRSVRDTAAMLDATAGSVPGDPYWAPPGPDCWLIESAKAPKRLRIAISLQRLGGETLHPDCEQAVRHAAELCASLGHIVEEATPRLDLPLLVPAFVATWSANLAALVDTMAGFTGVTPRADLFEGLTWGIYEAGQRVSASEYLRAKNVLQAASRDVASFFATHDIWLTTTLGMPPIKLGTFDLEEQDVMKGFLPLFDYVPFTAFQNVTGQPAINLPLHWNADGLPIGVQFAGRFGDELTLLQLATQLEQAAPWMPRYACIKV